MQTRPLLLVLTLFTACPVPTTDPGPVDPAACTVWDGASSGTLADDCYRLEGDVRVSNAIVIEAGTVVVAAANASLLIEEQGSLRVNGTQEDPVRFEGVSAGAGTWRGIGFSNTPSGENTLSWLQIDGAGGSGWNGADGSGGALFADGGTRIAADHITISNSASVGVNWWDDSVNATLDTLTVQSTVQAMTLFARHTSELSGTFDLNGDDPTLHIRRDIVAEDTVMPGFAYTIDEGLDVAANLTIEPGATLSFVANAGVVINNGSLNAEGTMEAPIILQGLESVAGYWRGVHIETSPSANNVWTYVSVLDAGSQPWDGRDDSDAALYLDGENIRLTVTDSRIANSGSTGLFIEVDNVGDTLFFNNVAFDDNVEPIKSTPAGIFALGVSQTFAGNDQTHIRVLRGDLEESGTWRNHAIDYVLPEGLRVYSELTFGPGVDLKFGSDTSLEVSDIFSGGTLIADTDGGAPIVFTGMQQTAGFWRGISFDASTGGNIFNNVRVENAGSSSWNGIPTNIASLYVTTGTQLTLTNVGFSNNLGQTDVLVDNTGTVISGCTGITGTFRGDDDSTFCDQ